MIPIDKDKHWSFLVVISPGLLAPKTSCSSLNENEGTCMLFFDPWAQGLNDARDIQCKMQEWLMHELRMIYPEYDVEGLTVPLYTPDGTSYIFLKLI